MFRLNKDEKIDELNSDINDANYLHQDYIEQTDGELRETEEKIDLLNNEMEEANNILNNIPCIVTFI